MHRQRTEQGQLPRKACNNYALQNGAYSRRHFKASFENPVMDIQSVRLSTFPLSTVFREQKFSIRHRYTLYYIANCFLNMSCINYVNLTYL